MTGRDRPLLLAGVAGSNTLGAGSGAIALAAGWLDLGAAVTGRLPWGSATVGAVALALIVALPNGVLTVLAWRGDARCGPLSIVSGGLLVGWIIVELGFIRDLSFLHPFYVGVGLLQCWLGARVVRDRCGIHRSELLREVADVAVDLPVFLTAPLYRRWHLTWHATDAEVAAPMPGDGHLPRPAYLSTRAVTIDAPPDRVWPWLVQIGCLRAGFYSDDLLDNLGHPSSRRLMPDLQDLGIGRLVPMSPHPTDATSFRVEAYDVPHYLLWAKSDSTWSWLLTEETPGRTRVVTRIRAVHDWRNPAAGLLSMLLLELGDFAMVRRMLRGIKHRAESLQGSTDR